MTQAGLWTGTAVAASVALAAGLVEWRQSRRWDLDRVGLVPWGAVSLIGFVAAVVGLSLGLKG